MNIQQLEYIIAVDRLKNFTKAATACHVTQATLSAMIKKLEEELNVVIFDRKTSPVITTDIGQVVLDQARKVVLHAHLLHEKVKTEHTVIEGQIRLGIIPTVANALLPRIIKPLFKHYPKLQIEVTELTTENIIKQLKEGTLDMGILATPLQHKEIEEDILFYEMLMVYGKVGKNKKYILPEEVREHKIWLLEEGHCLRNQFEKLCSLKKKTVLPGNLRFEANSFETLLNMVDEFGGLTLIPELYYQTLPPARKRQIRFFENAIPVREVSLVYYREFAKKRVTEAIAACIKEIICPTLLSAKYKNKDMVIASP